jgi:pimeloyl-ACP methyl ester carboxylesterase
MPFCKINDIRLYYEDYDEKDQVPLIFLHGLMGSGESWRFQVDHFKDKRRVIAFDLRGHGQSDKPLGKYSMKQFSEDLFSFVQELGIEKAVIAGHSMGGIIALRFALDHKEMVEKLILIDTGARTPLGKKLLVYVSKIILRISYKTFVKIYLSGYTFPKGYSKSKIGEAQERVLKTPKHVVDSCFSAVKEFDVTSDLGSIQVPTLIIHGSEDKQQPLSQAKYVKEHISNAEIVIIEGAGHATLIETPEKIWEAIGKFIAT